MEKSSRKSERYVLSAYGGIGAGAAKLGIHIPIIKSFFPAVPCHKIASTVPLPQPVINLVIVCDCNGYDGFLQGIPHPVSNDGKPDGNRA